MPATAVLLAAIVLASCSGGVPTDRLMADVVMESPGTKPSFVLTDTSGQPYDFAEQTAGKLTLLYFGYTFCPDICPVHLAQIAETIQTDPALGRNLEVVFVSVDPNRDTLDVIRSYLDSFSTRFVGLTGTTEELRIAQEAAGVPVAVARGDDVGYSVDHAAWVIAYAPDGLNHANYPFGTRQVVWANDLRVLGSMQTGPQ